MRKLAVPIYESAFKSMILYGMLVLRSLQQKMLLHILPFFQVRAAECHDPSGDVPLPAEGERCGPMEDGPFPPDSMEEDLPGH